MKKILFVWGVLFLLTVSAFSYAADFADVFGNGAYEVEANKYDLVNTTRSYKVYRGTWLEMYSSLSGPWEKYSGDDAFDMKYYDEALYYGGKYYNYVGFKSESKETTCELYCYSRYSSSDWFYFYLYDPPKFTLDKYQLLLDNSIIKTGQIKYKADGEILGDICFYSEDEDILDFEYNDDNSITLIPKSSGTVEIFPYIESDYATGVKAYFQSMEINGTEYKGVARGKGCIVTVICHPQSVELDENNCVLSVNETKKLNYEVYPEGAENKKVVWSSSNTAVATVDQTGKITGKKKGTAIITVKTEDGGFTDTCEVHVVTKKATGVEILYCPEEMFVGEEADIEYSLIPADADPDSVIWTSGNDSEYISVDQKGHIKVLKYKNGGSEKIKLSYSPYGEDDCESVYIKILPRINVEISRKRINLVLGESFRLSANAVTGDTDNKDIYWSSANEEVASVTYDGLVQSLSLGNTVIFAKSDEYDKAFATCAVYVVDSPIPLQKISLSPTTANMYIGDKLVLNATLTPADSTDMDLVWSSSNNSVARVDQSGTVIAVGKGSVTITARAKNNSGIQASCQLAVVSDKAEKIVLDKKSISLGKNKTAALTATVLPESAKNKDVVWKSKDETIATVDSKGNVKGIKAGSTVIRALSAENSKIYADCKVTVTDTVPVTGVELDKTSITVNVGDITALKATVKPTNATNKDVEWKSSNTNIVKVNTKGEFKAYKAGKATVSVRTKDGKFVASCKVTVKDSTVHVTGVELDKTSITVNVGDITALKATVKPTNATNKDVEWKSSNTSIVKVNAKGEFKAYKAGKATVSVRTKDGKFIASCKVTVKDKTVPVTGVKLDRTSVTASVGEIVALHATVLPSNATNKNVTWKSSNTNIVKVNSKGEFKTYKKGTATITVTTKDGSKTATCKVTVK